MSPTSQQPNPEPEDFLEIGGSPVPGITLRQVLRGHTDRVNRIAWSRDGRYLASPSRDKTIRVWDAEHGKCVSVLREHADTVYTVAWLLEHRSSNRGRRVLAVGVTDDV